MREHRWLRWPAATTSPNRPGPLAYGADYNPEQWSPDTWREDVELMRRARVNIVNLGIFSWAEVEPEPGQYRWDWLDEIIDLLHTNGIAIDLGTGTASPPPWLSTQHPEILPVTADERTLGPGGRQHWRPTSPVFREYALNHVRAVAARYGEHPALAMWHISNELGCHNIHDYSDDAAVAFRLWLRRRYGTLEELNQAWTTSFWSQRYTAWEQVLPPRQAASFRNPVHQLDFSRFSSDALLDYLCAEAAVLREMTPDIPVTSNFMVMGDTKGMNYAGWRDELDVVSNDHYVLGASDDGFEELAFSANLVRGLARSRPWFLMEQSTGAVNWQPINLPKAPGQLGRDSLAHLAHGADGISFFQWRQSAGGAEKYHSAMVPHGGTETRVWREVCELGAALDNLAEVAGSAPVPSRVALLFDWEAWWASELDSHPSELFRYRRLLLDWFKAFADIGASADVQPVADDFASYDMVVAPGLYLVSRENRERVAEYVRSGGHFVTTFFSGVVDELDRVVLGGYPGAFRELLGVRIEEFGPLLAEQQYPLAGGGFGSLWADPIDVVAPDVTVLATYAFGERAGEPAATRRAVGSGSATYVGTRMDPTALRALTATLAERAGIEPDVEPSVAEAVLRREREHGGQRYVFLLNRTREPQRVKCEGGFDLLRGQQIADAVELAPLGVAVLRRPR